MRLSKVTGFIAGLLTAGVAHSAVFFTTEASFLAATDGGALLTLETYENVTIPGGSSTFVTTPSGLTIGSNTPLSDLDNSSACAGTSDCVSFFTPSTGSLALFTFGSTQVSAFGLLLSDLGTVGTTTVTVMTSGGATQSFTVPSNNNFNSERFFGVVSEEIFVSVAVSNTASGDFVTIDNTYFGLPEPTTLLLLGAGLLGFGAMRRRV